MSKRLDCLKIRPVVTLLIVGFVGACASEPGTRSGDSPVVTNPGVMWEDGAKAVDTGEAMLTRGEERLELGHRQVREGNAKIREGSERAAKTKLEYEQAAAAGSRTFNDKAQASALRAIGLRWEAALEEIKNGNKLVAKGNANIDRGESEVREGRLLMETGSVLMRNAHRSRLGQALLPLPTG